MNKEDIRRKVNYLIDFFYDKFIVGYSFHLLAMMMINMSES
jgi:hypothetical protein